MRFYVRKRRQTPGVIIVALIDVLIVLLIFLLVTSTFKQQPFLKLALPESSQAQKTGASETAPVVLSIDDRGNMRFGPDSHPVTFEDLKAALLEQTTKNPDLKLAINADGGAPWRQIVKVMDLAKVAKIKSINAFTKEPGKS
jgi:biopolymer transport protein ExbD